MGKMMYGDKKKSESSPDSEKWEFFFAGRGADSMSVWRCPCRTHHADIQTDPSTFAYPYDRYFTGSVWRTYCPTLVCGAIFRSPCQTPFLAGFYSRKPAYFFPNGDQNIVILITPRVRQSGISNFLSQASSTNCQRWSMKRRNSTF